MHFRHSKQFAWLTAGLLAASVSNNALAAPAPSTSAASPSLHDTLSGAARDEYDSGRILFDNDDYAGALVKFQHAFDLSSDPRLLWNMGACEKNLRHYARLLRLINRYLHEGGSSLSDAQRADANMVAQTVRALVSTIRLNVNVADASVFVDGAKQGTTPMMEPLLVDLGDRRLRVSKVGYKDQELVLHVAGASEIPVSIALEKQPVKSQLAIGASPSSAAIHLDGVLVGTGSWQGAVTAGRHTLLVTASGMSDRTTDVSIAEGQSRSVDIALERESGGSAALWWIGGGLLAAGLGVGGYFLLHSSSQPGVGAPTQGTISPGYINIPGR
jgi:hypothetical protein